MNEASKRKKITLKLAVLIQAVVLIYTLSGVAAKMASAHEFLSLPFIFWYGFEIVILGIYAIFWQQIIKRVDLSIAYANRAVSVLWSLLWAFLIFQEKIYLNNVIGVIIVLIGTIIVNSDEC